MSRCIVRFWMHQNRIESEASPRNTVRRHPLPLRRVPLASSVPQRPPFFYATNHTSKTVPAALGFSSTFPTRHIQPLGLLGPVDVRFLNNLPHVLVLKRVREWHSKYVQLIGLPAYRNS